MFRDKMKEDFYLSYTINHWTIYVNEGWKCSTFNSIKFVHIVLLSCMSRLWITEYCWMKYERISLIRNSPWKKICSDPIIFICLYFDLALFKGGFATLWCFMQMWVRLEICIPGMEIQYQITRRISVFILRFWVGLQKVESPKYNIENMCNIHCKSYEFMYLCFLYQLFCIWYNRFKNLIQISSFLQ